MKRLAFLTTLLSIILFGCLPQESITILISEDASPLEQMAAKEIRRYVYLRTGELLPIVDIVFAGKPTIGVHINENLEEQEYSLKTTGNSLDISGGTPQAVLYGAYEFAEQLGSMMNFDLQNPLYS